MIPKMENRITNFKELGFGLFVHYGPYMQYNNGEWAMDTCNHDPKEYEEKALSCDYSSFDANKLISSAKSAGARYITFTTRHHDGFSLYDTRGLSDYDVMHTPKGKDIVKEFVDACHENDIMPFLYHTTLDWHHPEFNGDFKKYLKYLRQSIEILCRNYGEIGGFWLDGNWSHPNSDWELDELYSIIREYQPNAILVNNTGLAEQGVFGHKEIDCVTFEQGTPQKLDLTGMKKAYMGEMCYPLCEHWGIAQDINVKSMKDILGAMMSARKVDGNILLGVFITLDGSLSLLHQGYLEAIGAWTKKHKEPFYKGNSCVVEGFDKDFALEVEGSLYLFIHDVSTWGDSHVVNAKERSYSIFKNVNRKISCANWLDNNGRVVFSQDAQKGLLFVEPTPMHYGESWVIRVAKIEFE